MDKASFFKKSKPKVVDVEYEGETYYVKHLSVSETCEYELAVQKLKGNSKDTIIKTLIFCVCDAEGKPLFTDEDAEQLKVIDSNLAVKLSKAAFRLNEMTEEQLEQLKKS